MGDITRLIYKTRHKTDKTTADELLLEYHYKLALITEILIEQSKWHISDGKTIEEIRDVFRQ